MSDSDSRMNHWNDVYTRKRETEVSWFQHEADVSLALIERCAVPRESRIIDVGGGASRLLDGLLDRGYEHVTVLDISRAALETARRRIAERGASVQFIESDITTFQPKDSYAVWHDRAVFHFLTAPTDRFAYVQVLSRAVKLGGYVIVGTFAEDGPTKCSGLDVARYDATSLAAVFGSSFALQESLRHQHVTPSGSAQSFTFIKLLRIAA